MENKKPNNCPCDSGLDYAECCGPYLENKMVPATAEALMRSRYTAYTEKNVSYLRSTWYPSTCPANLEPLPQQQWTGLKIMDKKAGQASDESGQVEFVARYKINGRAEKLHERSEFVKLNGRWLYVGALVDNR